MGYFSISVVMPTYNVEKYIGEAIKSIINQSFTDWELIIVDDCSADNTVKFVEVMEKYKDIVVAGSDIVGLNGTYQNPMMCDGNWRSSFGWITEPFRKRKTDAYDLIDNYAESHYLI